MSDVYQRMLAIVEEMIPAGDFRPLDVGRDVIVRLQETEPDLLDEWVAHKAPYVIAEQIKRLMASRRTHDGGNVLAGFDAAYCIDRHESIWRHIGQMKASNHLETAAEYDRSVRPLMMLAEFHRAVAKRIGRRTTAQVMTEDEYFLLRKSITGLVKGEDAA